MINRLCPCCGVDPEFTPLGLSCDNMELADLGAGYVMYFKMCIFFGIVMLVFAGINIIKVIANMKGGNCVYNKSEIAGSVYVLAGYPPCSLDWITYHSIANYSVFRVDSTEKTGILLFFLAYWLVLSGCKSWISKTNKLIDVSNDTPSDWTIVVKGLPADEPVEQIKANFEAFGALGKMHCPIKKISLAYNCREYTEMAAKVNQSKRKMKILQVKETPEARKRMEARLLEKKDAKNQTKEDIAKMKPGKIDFSAEFQRRFEELTEETRKVDLS